MIHLVRDPRQVLQSHLWRVRSDAAGHNAPLYLASMAAKWTLVNLACEVMARAFRDRVVRVRFEDLCAQPASELDRIGRAFELDLSDLGAEAAGDAPLTVGHNIGGNRLRHAGSVQFDPGGGRPRPPLPRWLAVAAMVICGPLMWRYGYRLRSGGSPPPTRASAPVSG